MIGEGMKVKFVPCFESSLLSPEEKVRRTITGKIVYINWEHRYFTVEYDSGGTKQKESFNFWQIGKAVKVIG